MQKRSRLVLNSVWPFIKPSVYLDYAASTPVDKVVFRAMKPYFQKIYANPFSSHQLGQVAAISIKDSIKSIATNLHCPALSIVITSGATESNALAIQGVIETALKNFTSSEHVGKPHVIISAIEHPSVNVVKYYYKNKLIDLDILPVDSEGLVDSANLSTLLRPETVLVSIMLVNSEIGTIQPITEIAKVIKRFRTKNAPTEGVGLNYPLLHSDASQALLTIPINIQRLHVDLLTINAHKIYGPKGVGLLYINPIIKELIEPLIKSGYEGLTFRPGTPATGLIVGLATAVNLAYQRHDEINKKLSPLQHYLFSELNKIGGIVNGSINPNYRVVTNINVSFQSDTGIVINHEYLQMQLDAAGIMTSTRSACLERGVEGSVVLQALFQKGEGDRYDGQVKEVRNALRISMGWETTKSDLNRLLAEIKKSIKIQESAKF